MAVQLEDYLRNELPVRKSEIEKIGATAGAVLSSFALAFDSNRKAWPYRLNRDCVPTAADSAADPDLYSFSTNAMVLFALSAILGDFQNLTITKAGKKPGLSWSSENVGLLTPMLAQPDPNLVVNNLEGDPEPDKRRDLWRTLVKDFRPKIDETRKELANQINAQLAKHPRLTRSGTFGDNDPFTLSWTLEAVEVQAPWVAHLSKRAQDALKNPRTFVLLTEENAASGHAPPSHCCVACRCIASCGATGTVTGNRCLK